VARKYTRKQLKKPDEFITFSFKVWQFLRAHSLQALVSLGVAGVIIGTTWLYTTFSDSRAQERTSRVSRGVEIYNQTVIPTTENLPKSDDGIPRYKTRADKLRAAEEEFDKILTASSSGGLGRSTLLLRASARFDRGRYAEAAKDYQKFLAETDEDYLRPIVEEALGYCYEGMGKLDDALAAFRRIGSEGGEARFTSMYHEARILAKKGQVKEAVALLHGILEKATTRSLVDQASDRLALLEGAGATAPAAKPNK
jgi:tetratricopeptide (TPR) repeat protein